MVGCVDADVPVLRWPRLSPSSGSKLDTVFDGKTMFSFMFDFGELGDPQPFRTKPT